MNDWSEDDLIVSFVPHPDITAYELALIYKKFVHGPGQMDELVVPRHVWENRDTEGMWRNFILRHDPKTSE